MNGPGPTTCLLVSIIPVSYTHLLASFFGISNPDSSFDDYDETNEADQLLKQALTNLYKRQTGCYELADEQFAKAAELYRTQLETSPDDESLKNKACLLYTSRCV